MTAAVLDTDTLLENDMVTLDEALRTTHNAVLMAMDAISILLSVSKLVYLYFGFKLFTFHLLILRYYIFLLKFEIKTFTVIYRRNT